MNYPFPDVLDSSITSTFKQCPQLFNRLYIQNWKPKEHSVHLHAGGAFAKGVEVARRAYYTGVIERGLFVAPGASGKQEATWTQEKSSTPVTAEDAIAWGLRALLFAYGSFECPPDSAKSAERMAGALEFYFERYPLNEDSPPITLPSGKRGIEFSFVQPLPILHPETGDPLLYSGRMDAILAYAGGKFLTDEKTTTSLGATWSRQWDLRAQFTGYAWGCKENGIEVDGALIRGVSILKTKYDTAESISYRPQWMIDRWFDELCSEWIPDMIRMWKSNKFRHNLDHACAEFGGCTFRSACMSEDPQPWLETFFERRHWDPITRIETKL